MILLQNDTKATVKEHPQIYHYDKNIKQKNKQGTLQRFNFF